MQALEELLVVQSLEVDTLKVVGEQIAYHLLNRVCANCEEFKVYCHWKFDAYFCLNCNLWLEKTCGGEDCEYCGGRPETPFFIKNGSLFCQPRRRGSYSACLELPMEFNVRTIDLAKLNSLTKYPSIPTYHTLDPKNGGLIEVATAFDGQVIGTEKVDGTNSRIIVTPDGQYLIGSREELLYAKGDLISNPSLGIVDALKETAERLCSSEQAGITVYYLEVFGGKVTAASKQYTGKQGISFRLFDIARLGGYDELLSQTPAQIAAWRDGGGQPFADEAALQQIADEYGLTLTPRLFTINGAELPQEIPEMLAFLRARLAETLCRLDEAAGGKPEGIVLRSPDRATIAKARFEDYERTLKRKKPQ